MSPQKGGISQGILPKILGWDYFLLVALIQELELPWFLMSLFPDPLNSGF